MKRIIFPGWGVPVELYLPYKPDDILDFGFFTGDDRDCATNAIEVHPDELNDLFLKKMIPEEPCVIIAHSLGSLLALRSSQLSLSIKAVVIIGGFAKFTQSDPDYPDGQLESGVVMMQNLMKLSPKMVLDKFYQAMVSPAEYSITPTGKADVARLRCGLQYLIDTDFRTGLKDIDVPVLILHGDQDKIVSAKLAEYLAGNISHAELHMIENAGHAMPFTHQNECLRLIDAFIAGNDF